MLNKINSTDILDYVFKLLSTISALTPAIFVYMITNYKTNLNKELVTIISDNEAIFFIAYIILSVLIILFLNSIFLRVVNNLDDESMSNINTVEPVNDNFLPTYLGYFFVSVSITSNWVFGYFMILVILFNLFSKVYFFNPSLLISGFKFYHLTSDKGVKILLISKDDLRSHKDISSSNYKRINDFTFIKVE